MSIKKHMPSAYRRVARTVCCSLLLTNADAWNGLTVALKTNLCTKERVAMAWAVLRSLTPEHIAAVAETVLPKGTSAPIAPFSNHLNEASFWADMAEPKALEAYCLASFNAMPSPRQKAFLDFVQRKAAA